MQGIIQWGFSGWRPEYVSLRTGCGWAKVGNGGRSNCRQSSIRRELRGLPPGFRRGGYLFRQRSLG